MDKKKIGIIVGIVLLVVLLVLCSTIKPKGEDASAEGTAEEIYYNAVEESKKITEDERREYTEITVAEYLEKFASSERYLFLLGRETCQYCEQAKPILQKISKDYDVEILYLDTDHFSDDDITNFISSDETFNGSIGTPFLFVTENGQILGQVDGIVDTASYLSFLRTYGIVKE